MLISTRPSAPASTTDWAISTMLVTSGDSFAKTGTFGCATRRTAEITRPAAIGSQANTWPRLCTFGQEMFTSIRSTGWL